MDLLRRLATSQARGERQLSLVNELLSFYPVPTYYYEVPGLYGSKSVLFGKSRLPIKSWKNLRKRLVTVGFVVERDFQAETVTLHFPEMNI